MVKRITTCGAHGYLKRTAQNFGVKFLVLLVSVYVGIKGVFFTLITNVQLPYYKSRGIDGATYQSYQAVSMAPWAMKGIIGAVSDSVAIWGYHKRFYMSLGIIVGGAAMLGLALLPQTSGAHSISALLFLAANFEIATLDLLCEGKYAELISETSEGKSDILTFVWMCVSVGTLVGAGISGPLADRGGTSLVFWIALPLALHALFPVLRGFLSERKVSSKPMHVNTEVVLGEKKLLTLAVVLSVGALILAAVGIATPRVVQCIVAISIAVVLVITALVCMPRQMAMCNIYIFLQDCLYLQLTGATDFWYTADETCVPDGPHFSYTYYQTYSLIVGTIASAVGVYLFQVWISKLRIRTQFWVTTAIRMVASLADVVMIQRWNVWLGIPDRMAYMLGDAIVMPICQMAAFMPAVLLTSQLCPKNVESTVYALLAGYANLGNTVGKVTGGYALDLAGIQTTVPCDFSNLTLLLVIGHLLMPALSLALTFVLLPNSIETKGDYEPAKTTDADVELELRQAQPISSSPSVDDSGVVRELSRTPKISSVVSPAT